MSSSSGPVLTDGAVLLVSGALEVWEMLGVEGLWPPPNKRNAKITRHITPIGITRQPIANELPMFFFFFATALLMALGLPQFGQAGAALEISFPQSGHFTSAIILSLLSSQQLLQRIVSAIINMPLIARRSLGPFLF